MACARGREVVARQITTHSIRPPIGCLSSSSIVMEVGCHSRRRLNSSVRFLLNSLAQSIESIILSCNETEDYLNANTT